MIYRDEEELFDHCKIEIDDNKVEFNDLDFFKENAIENLVDTILLSHSIHLKKICHWVVYEAANKFGIIPSSIQTLYEARVKDTKALVDNYVKPIRVEKKKEDFLLE